MCLAFSPLNPCAGSFSLPDARSEHLSGLPFGFWHPAFRWKTSMEECLLYSDPEFFDFLSPGSGDLAAVCEELRRKRIRTSERFYLEEARSREGHVLELACGTGRLTIPSRATTCLPRCWIRPLEGLRLRHTSKIYAGRHASLRT